MSDPIYYDYVSSFTTHMIYFLSGSTAISIIAHAVNTFPMPKSAIGRWFLGVVQYTVGQRIQGANTLNGHNSVMVPEHVLEQAKEVLSTAPITATERVTVIPGTKDSPDAKL